jgi:hypothetical protein
MRGLSNKLTSDLQLQPLYRGTLNGLCAISDAGLELQNRVNAQQLANSTLSTDTPDGILAGSVVAVVAALTVGPAKATKGALDGIVGIAVRNADGEAYDSTRSEASGGITYLHGTGTVVEIPVYETVATDGTTPLVYAAGEKLYASQNGLLTNASGLADAAAAADATVVAILLDPPTANNKLMTVQLRV